MGAAQLDICTCSGFLQSCRLRHARRCLQGFLSKAIILTHLSRTGMQTRCVQDPCGQGWCGRGMKGGRQPTNIIDKKWGGIRWLAGDALVHHFLGQRGKLQSCGATFPDVASWHHRCLKCFACAPDNAMKYIFQADPAARLVRRGSWGQAQYAAQLIMPVTA